LLQHMGLKDECVKLPLQLFDKRGNALLWGQDLDWRRGQFNEIWGSELASSVGTSAVQGDVMQNGWFFVEMAGRGWDYSCC
jgi:hypothetical protein